MVSMMMNATIGIAEYAHPLLRSDTLVRCTFSRLPPPRTKAIAARTSNQIDTCSPHWRV